VRGQKRFRRFLEKEIEMNFALWLPVLLALGIVAMGAGILVLAVVDTWGPRLVHGFKAGHQTLGGAHTFALAHGVKH
jgi:hypothetical protein